MSVCLGHATGRVWGPVFTGESGEASKASSVSAGEALVDPSTSYTLDPTSSHILDSSSSTLSSLESPAQGGP